jgi:hypothetical protein
VVALGTSRFPRTKPRSFGTRCVSLLLVTVFRVLLRPSELVSFLPSSSTFPTNILEAFNDDICGISYSVRWNAVQIAVWNRDAENEAGKEQLLKTILEKLSEELQPKKEDSYWYKAHKEHKGFIEQ